MSVEYNPEGVTCNLGCAYCYEHPQRDAGNFNKQYNEEAVKKALEAEGTNFSMFGGEPLLAGKEHLEEMWRWGYEKYGVNGIQTNGTLIDEDHMELFRKYNVNVGMSMDGPDELNDSRWVTNLDDTREATKKSMENLDKLLKSNISCSLIVTLYQGNVRYGRFEKLKNWLRELDRKGLRSARIHLLEVDHEEVKKKMKLTDDENVQCLIELHDLEKQLNNLQFDIFNDIRKLLLGKDSQVTCVWNACDPYTTEAVHGVDSNGDRHNCGRTNKSGVNWFKADKSGHERQLSLYHTPWENNGCKGCRFFVFCKGEGPGTGENADWRNKTDQCWVWYKLFEHVEESLVEQGYNPVSLDSNLKIIERYMLNGWSNGKKPTIEEAIRNIKNGKMNSFSVGKMGLGSTEYGSNHKSHGDSHGDAPHGDHTDDGSSSPTYEHGDSHGDHVDDAILQNQEHGDSHGDAPHGDHRDTGKINK